MELMKFKDGYVDVDRIESIKRSTYMYAEKYRVLLTTCSGDTLIYDEYETKEECDKVIEKLANQLIDLKN